MGTLLLVGLAWVWSLQNTVKRQTQVIREKLAREAVLSERSRIAREIHDGLAQAIAAVSIHLEGIRIGRSRHGRRSPSSVWRPPARSCARPWPTPAGRSGRSSVPTEALGLENGPARDARAIRPRRSRRAVGRGR